MLRPYSENFKYKKKFINVLATSTVPDVDNIIAIYYKYIYIIVTKIDF